jgi:ribosomal protein S18 acetylase RimI-like enzyme
MTAASPVKGRSWKLRRLLPDDWAEFRALRLRALADAPEAFGSTAADAERLTEAQWRHRLASRMTIAAETGGSLVGLAAGTTEEPPGAELVSMWVDPSWRGEGIGDALVRAVERWAAGQGFSRLRLWVAVGNDRAERFYTRLGFTRTGRRQPMGKEAGNQMELEMARPLENPSPDDGQNEAQ